MAQLTQKSPVETALGLNFLDRPLSAIGVSTEVLAYAGMAVIAAIMRFWDLGARAMHHDESLHVLYSWYLYAGRGYQHDPMMHGPFQFHANTLIYFLFGDTDFTARILYAAFGTALVLLPFLLRGFIGKTGALVTAALLVISPTMLYYSRFARNDIIMAVWNLTMAYAAWKYLETKHSRYLILGAAMLSVGFATKETQYITVAVMGSFFTAYALWELASRGKFPSLEELRGMPIVGVLIMLGSLSLPQLSAFARLTPFITADPTQIVLGPWITTRGILSEFLVAGALFAVTALVGLWWNRTIWPVYTAVFYAIYVLLYTTFFTNLPGLGSGVWGSLSYWLDQQGVMRGNQPWYYYLLLLPLYEFLPIMLAAGGLLWYLVRRQTLSPFAAFVLYWFVAGTAGYSKAGEKMPWLAVHMALPLIVFAGISAEKLLGNVSWKSLRNGRAFMTGALLLLGAVVFASALGAAISPTRLETALPARALFLALIGALLVAGAIQAGRGLGRTQIVAITATSVILLMGVLTARAALTAAYKNGDTASEMLIYTQSTPDITRLMKQIDDISLRTTGGTDLRVSVDSTSGFTWPWAWYLRHYKNVDYPNLAAPTGPPTGQVVLVHANNLDRMKPFLTDYSAGERYRHRWWFPEDYKSPIEWIAAMGSPDAGTAGKANDAFTLREAIAASISPEGLETLWKYFFNRDLGKPLGSEDGYIFVKQGLGGTDSAPAAAVPPRVAAPDEYTTKRANVAPSLTFGSRGTGAGQFTDPKGIAVDLDGSIYVLDTGNNRLQKFDPTGKLINSIGRKGTGDGEFTEPWGIAIGPDGNVWVADTWNHRIQRFTSSLQFVGKFGEFGEASPPVTGNPGRFYGPRSIAFLADGSLIVTDTGNKRIQRFSQDGRFISSLGGQGTGPGQFQEPVGLASGSDGAVWVVDTWNHRIQRFDQDMRSLTALPVKGWESTGILNKPYISAEPGGSLVVTDPENHRIIRFGQDGQVLTVIGKLGSEPGAMNLPTGVATDIQGNIYVVESGNSRVQKFDAATLPQ